MTRPESASFDEADVNAFFDISHALFSVVDRTGHLLRLSASWRDLLGWDIESMLGHSFVDYLHEQDVEPTLARLRDGASLAHDGPITNRYRHADGTYRTLRWHTQTSGDGNQIRCVAHDVTDEVAAIRQQQLVADLGRQALEGGDHAQLLKAAVDGVADCLDVPVVAILEHDLGGGRLKVCCQRGLSTHVPQDIILMVDSATVSGRAVLTLQTQTATDLLSTTSPHPHHVAQTAHAALATPIAGGETPWGVLSVADHRPREFASGQVRFAEQVAHILAAAIERRAVESRLQHQATHDDLTGLPNRELLRQRLNLALSNAAETGQPLGLLLCDLDGFKDVNDSLGHAAGDTVLQQLAARLAASVGPGDTVARLGGDEFAICVVSRETEIELLGVADEIVRVMRQPFRLPELEVPLSTSIGVAINPANGSDGSTLLRHADIAMYRAKAAGLGWSRYDASVDGARSDRLVLTADLRGAIATDSLQVHFQPVVDLTTGRVHSLEALCRWDHVDRGNISPTSFIPLAEQTGTILPLTTWVVREVVSQLDRWRAQGLELTCAVNLSMAAVADTPATAGLVDELVAAADRVSVEITESWLVDERGREVIAKLAQGGVRLSLDDFGTGFSSLASLRAFPVAQLKLDREFVQDLDDEKGHDVLLAVAHLGKALGMEVVAEGVEDVRTAAWLRSAGVPLGQGFLWSQALPADELTAWLLSRN